MFKLNLRTSLLCSCALLGMAFTSAAQAAQYCGPGGGGLPALAPPVDIICDDTVDTADLAPDAVTTAEIMDATITTDDIGDGEVQNADLGADAVTTDKIKDGEVQNADLGADAVTTDKIKDGEVKTNDLANGAVTEPKMANNSVSTRTIQDGAVTMPKLGADVITRFENIESDVKDANAGISLSMAMANIPSLSQGKDFSIGGGIGTFKGEFGYAIGANMRFDDNVVGRISAGGTDRKDFGAGAGIAIEF